MSGENSVLHLHDHRPYTVPYVESVENWAGSGNSPVSGAYLPSLRSQTRSTLPSFLPRFTVPHHSNYSLLKERQFKCFLISLLEKIQRCHFQAKNEEVLLMEHQS